MKKQSFGMYIADAAIALAQLVGMLVGGSVGAMFQIMRRVLFFALLWIRRPVTGAFNLISGLSLLSLPVVLLAFPDSIERKIEMTLMFTAIGVFTMAVSWWYDNLLLFLSPEPIILKS